MSGVPKLLLIYAVAIPLAILLGFLISAPGMGSIVVIGLLLFLFLLPVLLQHHHLLLILFWGSAFNVFFLPGQPRFWLLLAFLSFGISWLNNIMGEKNFPSIPELTRPLLFFGIVVLATALSRGGLASRVFGGESYGGRGYYYIFGAILGFFALSAVRVPRVKAVSWTGWYFLSGVTFALSNLVFVLGPSFYILYLLLPPEYAVSQATSEMGDTDIIRITGLSPCFIAVICFLFARFGVRGVLDWRRPWVGIVFVLSVIAAGFGGFRSAYILIGLLFVIQFLFEGLQRTMYLPIGIGCGLAGFIAVFALSPSLPLSLQRAVSFIPGVRVSSEVAVNADESWQWRLDMWKVLLPEVPRYLVLGKGYHIDGEELYLVDLATQMGLATDSSEELRLAGGYHSGPVSVVLTFGIFGAIGFLWIAFAGIRFLYRNYRYGDPAFRQVNTFLLAFFVAHVIFFILCYGDIRDDLSVFTGVLGLSLSINGLVKKPARARRLAAAVAELQQI